jgi:DHA1 family multidrug resistance protein-like MFS transporter
VDVEANAERIDEALENAVQKDIEKNGYILVDWYGPDDPENPRNWSFRKRCFVLFEIALLTFSVYIGSAIYTASIPLITEKFNVSLVVATLGLSLFIEGYALGPMIFSPLQELPSLGRNPAYIYTLALFAILQIPAALSTNIGGLLTLRFLSGFFGSPALATGGASIGDIFPQSDIPYVIGLWAMAAVCGPVLGPIVGGFAANAEGWQWSIWELAWISGFSAIFLALLLPETLGGTILLKRAKRLRKLTGNDKLRSMSEIEQAEMSAGEVAKEYLIRPFQLLLEPAIFFIDLYIGLTYAIFYLWFESFPLVFTEIYGFKGGVAGLPFIGIIIGALLSYIFYVGYNYYYLGPKFVRLHFNVPPEEFLRLSCFAGIFIPVSLFLFGWSSRASVPWIVPIIGAALYVPGIFLLFQSAIVYLPISYPKYAASIFAGNTLVRSSVAAAFPLFGRTFFNHLGLGGGNSLLAGLSILMIPAMWGLFLYGHKLRAMSKYTTQ